MRPRHRCGIIDPPSAENSRPSVPRNSAYGHRRWAFWRHASPASYPHVNLHNARGEPCTHRHHHLHVDRPPTFHVQPRTNSPNSHVFSFAHLKFAVALTLIRGISVAKHGISITRRSLLVVNRRVRLAGGQTRRPSAQLALRHAPGSCKVFQNKVLPNMYPALKFIKGKLTPLPDSSIPTTLIPDAIVRPLVL